MKSNFDRLAAPYRWMEYLAFGHALQRCRLRFLLELTGTRNALLLGDGDGRFAAQLLRSAPRARVHAVDGSAAMLAALQRRCATAGASNRLTVCRADLTRGVPGVEGRCFDLVSTHFFLDCLSEQHLDILVGRVKPLITLEARWILSEFNIPQGKMRVPAHLLVWSLYTAFRLLTGLRVRRLPDYVAVFHRHGFTRVRRVPSLGGLLVSEIWVRTHS